MAAAPHILWLPVFTAGAEDRRYLLNVLAAIRQNDPGILVRADSEEILYSAVSLEHLQQTFDTITGQYKVPAGKGEPRVRYLETIRATAEAEGKYIRQIGGLGNFGHVKLRLEPADPASGVTFINAIQGGVIPQQFIPAIESGIRAAAQGGLAAGHDVAGLTATLFDGSFHEVDSNDMAFRIAASLAFKEAARKARPVVLEPVMAVVFTVHESQGSAIFREIDARSGRVEDVKIRGNLTIRALVPLQQMLSWSGPGSYIMLFSAYEPVRQDDRADEAGIAIPRPRGPSPRTDSAAADPEWDWT